jgi:membrane protein implicated in regulation of membrane protease activity
MSKTNIDTIIGKTGIVQEEITREQDGLAKVGNEQWRARSDVAINKGEEIKVIAVKGVTLIVKKTERGAS